MPENTNESIEPATRPKTRSNTPPRKARIARTVTPVGLSTVEGVTEVEEYDGTGRGELPKEVAGACEFVGLPQLAQN
jgi:hypothetical protein